MESPAAEYQLSKEPCNLIVASEEFGPTRGYGIATIKGSPWRYENIRNGNKKKALQNET